MGLNIDVIRQQIPAFYYRRFRLLTGTPIIQKQIFSIPLDYGFGYLLRNISSRWSAFDHGGALFSNGLDIELVHWTRGRRLQNFPYPLRLISTPGETEPIPPAVTGYVASPLPVDTTGFSINFFASPVRNRIVINEYYFYRETLYLELQFRSRAALSTDTNYIDVMLDGYLIPERSLDMWK